ncbi:site-specific integrase [Acinetobacter bohemicus]|uniref:Site-specific recombinase XerD n=1 Tax=Acinetobacter bohemicus TaxID=1435036 RepID=A0A1I6W633_9GAMM|nr:site-specific integrase [Acinetobacter bohemicus]KAB0650430.1 site-specific integrase [Acinetobacter bohemicus]SFT21410.1 Site-specific recombinase XerD [Acinetobacter bohemicus]
MDIEEIFHNSGELIPILLDDEGMPIPLPNEFILSKLNSSSNTRLRNLREIKLLYEWMQLHKIDLYERLIQKKPFTEAEIIGSLAPFLRKNHEKKHKIIKIAVGPDTFNQKLNTIKDFLNWYLEVYIGALPFTSSNYQYYFTYKTRLISLLDRCSINSPPKNKNLDKGLTTHEQLNLIKLIKPKVESQNPIEYRNYIIVMLMLSFGLRPGEVLSLRVEDIQLGSISSIRVHRRAPDIKDKRKQRPLIKRNGRTLAINDKSLAAELDLYITKWREMLDERNQTNLEWDYLIINKDGAPLSLPSITQYFQILRERHANVLPTKFSPKALRHTFSVSMERLLREAGVEEDNRKKALAYLRGDSSLSSQDVYTFKETELEANKYLGQYQREIFGI